MSAWALALCCLLSTDLSLVRPSSATELSIYLNSDSNSSRTTLDAMKRELSGLMQAAGYRVKWGDPRKPDKSGDASSLVVLELRGTCALPAGNFHVERSVASGASLAQTSVTDGSVLPFSWVNCANLTRMIGPALSGEPGYLRDSLYGRAMARVVAHELYHALMKTRDHLHDGVAKESFTVADLLDENFVFDHTAVAKLRTKSSGGDAGWFDTGR